MFARIALPLLLQNKRIKYRIYYLEVLLSKILLVFTQFKYRRKIIKIV